MIFGLITVGLLVVAVLWVIGVFNSLTRKQIGANGAWADIDVQLKRRHDLIPNLVNTVKGYASHEKETFERVMTARSAAMNAKTVGEHAGAENMLTQAVGRLIAVAEAYPDLKANQNFMQLQEELTSTENKIGFSRQHYNRSAGQYNESLAIFPSNIIGGMFSFKPMQFFEVKDDAVREAPKVQF